MTENPMQSEFQFESYIASLMNAMGMESQPAELQQELTLELGKQLAYRIMHTLTLNWTEEDIERAGKHTDASELSDLINRIIEESPHLKEKVEQMLDEFYNETLKAFEEFKNV